MRKVQTTEDGTTTLFDPRTGDTFHSVHGARSESEYIYLHCGLQHFIDSCTQLASPLEQINILEVGLGTGLNLLLTQQLATQYANLKFNYHSYELYPLEEPEWQQLKLAPFTAKEIETLHKSPWNKPINTSNNFTYTKHFSDFRTQALSQGFFHIIYYDAFAPSLEPSLWTSNLFINCYNSLNRMGIFITYSAKGEVRRNLIAAGFEVEKIPGPKGKREIIRATKPTH